MVCFSKEEEKNMVLGVESYQYQWVVLFSPQSHRDRIKSWIKGCNDIWPIITYALVIWLSLLWVPCCAPLLWRGNIQLIIAPDSQSICLCAELDDRAYSLLASLWLWHLYSQQHWGLAPANSLQPCVYLLLFQNAQRGFLALKGEIALKRKKVLHLRSQIGLKRHTNWLCYRSQVLGLLQQRWTQSEG